MDKNSKTLLSILIVVGLMIGLAFASLSHGFASSDIKWALLILVGAIAMRGAACRAGATRLQRGGCRRSVQHRRAHRVRDKNTMGGGWQ